MPIRMPACPDQRAKPPLSVRCFGAEFLALGIMSETYSDLLFRDRRSRISNSASNSYERILARNRVRWLRVHSAYEDYHRVCAGGDRRRQSRRCQRGPATARTQMAATLCSSKLHRDQRYNVFAHGPDGTGSPDRLLRAGPCRTEWVNR